MIQLLLLMFKNCKSYFYSRLLGDEQQIGGFDLIYNKTKAVKHGGKNFSFLGCFNNRQQQMRKMAKGVALRLADQAK